jgi:hypothetical protein
MKIKLNEQDIYNIVNESIQRCLNEMYGNYQSVFYGYTNLQTMEKLVYKFTLKSVEENDFNDFVEGMTELYKMAVEKQEIDSLNLIDLYKQAISNGDENIFWDNNNVSNFYYIDDYINHIDMWEKYMPKPEIIKQGIEEFAEWFKTYIEHNIEQYTKEKWAEYRNYIKQINNTI